MQHKDHHNNDHNKLNPQNDQTTSIFPKSYFLELDKPSDFFSSTLKKIKTIRKTDTSCAKAGASRDSKHHNAPSSLQLKAHTIITSATGERYELLNTLNQKEAKDVFDKTGLQISPGKVVLGKGKFAKIRLGRKLAENGEYTYVAIRKLTAPTRSSPFVERAIAPAINQVGPANAANDRVEIVKDEATIIFEAFLREIDFHKECKKRISDGLMLADDSITIVNSKSRPTIYQAFPLAVKNGEELLACQPKANEPKEPWAQVAPYLIFSLVKTFAAMNAKGIFHHDFKPDNCLITGKGKMIVADFGAGIIYDENNLDTHWLKVSNFTQKSYCSPEHHYYLSSPHLTSPRKNSQYSDSWRLGLTLLQLVNPQGNEFFIANLYGKVSEPTKSKENPLDYLETKKYFVAKITELADGPILAKEYVPVEIREVILGLLNPDYTQRLTPQEALGKLQNLQIPSVESIESLVQSLPNFARRTTTNHATFFQGAYVTSTHVESSAETHSMSKYFFEENEELLRRLPLQSAR